MPTPALKSCGLAALLLALTTGSALADAIDGHWCSEQKAESFTIDGATIVTPAGTRLQGTYERHYYSYTVPAQEPGAGQDIFMTLVDENTIHLVHGKERAGVEVWKRCGPSV